MTFQKGLRQFMNILFICTGNTCRSPMSAYIMEKVSIENDLDILIESAGIFAEDGEGASENAIKALEEMGIDMTGHVVQSVSDELLEKADIVLTMTGGQKKLIEPYAGKKVYTLLEYAGSEGDISDPYGGDIEEYRETAQEIYDAIVDIAEKLPVRKNDDNN